MKSFLKRNGILFFIFFFIFLLFRYNSQFQRCLLNGCILFMENVFPFLFPMLILNDFLINYQFEFLIEKTFHKLFKPLFGFTPLVSTIFVLSLFSGTPTNAYLITNLVKEKKLKKEDASVILTYSCFLNPLFLYSILNTIFSNSQWVFSIMILEYFFNFLIAFFYRKYPYEEIKKENKEPIPFFSLLPKSLKKSLDTLLLILGTILFYLLLCEGLNFFISNTLINCLLNGLLEATGGLIKLSFLNVNFYLKRIIAALFISFMGFSIHTQIKNIILEEQISYKPFLKARIFQAILSAGCFIIIS